MQTIGYGYFAQSQIKRESRHGYQQSESDLNFECERGALSKYPSMDREKQFQFRHRRASPSENRDIE